MKEKKFRIFFAQIKQPVKPLFEFILKAIKVLWL